MAERYGMDEFWLEDNAFTRNPHQLLALIGYFTKRIKLGTTTPISIRPPPVIARDMMTLYEIAPKRVSVAVGLGTEKSRRTLRAGIETIKKIFKGQEVKFYGLTVNVSRLKINWPAHFKIPVYAAVNGLKNCETAAEVADGIHFAVMSAEYAGYVIQKIKEKKDVKDFKFINHIVTFVSEDYSEAQALARSYVRPTFIHIPYVYKISGFTDEDVEALKNWPREALRPEEIINKLMTKSKTEPRGVPKHVLDKLASKFTLYGTPEDIVKRLKEYERNGLDLITLTIFGPDIGDDIKILAERVFPEFQI